jgi:hypothetical protein
VNIESLVANGVETAFKILKDLVGLGTYYQAVSGSGSAIYDPVTDTAITPTQTFLDVRMIKVGVEGEELVGTSVTVTDVKLLIPAKDLPGVEPGNEDHIFLKGLRYNIVRVKEVPGNSLHILYAREA